MNKNLKRLVAIVLVIVMIVACVGCGVTGDEKTPESYNNVGYPLSEQTFESRVSRLFEDYVIETFGLFAQYKVKNFNKYTEDTFNWPYSYTFTLILDIENFLGEVKTYEANYRLNIRGEMLNDYEIIELNKQK